jgi:cysteine desulfurase
MIYLDNAATTRVEDEVVEAMLPFLTEKYGNASSVHSFGKEALEAIETSREVVASKINAKPEEIFFTSGGTESNNWAIKGVLCGLAEKKIVVSSIEHESVLETVNSLSGSSVDYLAVDEFGVVDLNEFGDKLDKGIVLASVMHANNEIGTVQDIAEVGKISREKGVLFHTDACQSLGKEDINVRKMNVDLMSLNAHKIHGPKGVGALFVKEGITISPLLHGGGQENALRSGTVNIPGAVGFAKAVEISKEDDIVNMRKLRNKLVNSVLEIGGVKLNGHVENRLCNNANFSFKLVEGGVLMDYLDKNGIIVSTGSACTSKSLEPSHVLNAIGLRASDLHGAIRISLSRYTTLDEIDRCVDVISEGVKQIRK